MAESRTLSSSVTRLDGATTLPLSEAPTNRKGTPPPEDREVWRATSRASCEVTFPSTRQEGETRRDHPKVKKSPAAENYKTFRRICDQLVAEVRQLDDFLDGDAVMDEGSQATVEIEHLLEKLYDCPWGEGESLKRVVVAIQAQVNNARWTARQVRFLQAFIPFLRVRYLIDQATIDACYEMMGANGLDEFRGTISRPEVLKRYRIEEITET